MTIDRARRRLSAAELNRATLDRQLLLGRARLDPSSALRRIVAIQAQEAASPYIALWNRLESFDPADLDAAFAADQIVKASLMRITLHAVQRADHRRFQHAMLASLRGSGLNDDRFRQIGLSLTEIDGLVPDIVAFARTPRTNDQLRAFLEERLGVRPGPGPWWALRRFAPLVHSPTGGPWSFGPRPAYRAAPTRAAAGDPAAATQYLLRRYLEGFGPAGVGDMAQFSMLRGPVIREAVAALGDRLVRFEAADGSIVYDVRGGRIPDGDAPAAPRLMAMWDSVLLAYADRSRLIPAEYRATIIRQNGDTLPTLLVDGHVAGVWRAVDGGIEASAFHRLPDDAWEGLALEARSLVAFLAGRDPAVYRRYGHWWTKLPRAEVRLLPGPESGSAARPGLSGGC